MMTRISTEQFAILEEVAPNATATVNLETQLGFKAAKDEKMIAVAVKFKFTEDEKPFIILDVICFFRIMPEDWAKIKQTDGSMVLPRDFLCHIAMHTVGTARGILHVKTESTPFNQYIIPPVNIDDMVDGDITISAEC